MMAMLHYGMLSAELTHSVVQVHVKQVQWEASAVRGGNKLQGLDEDRSNVCCEWTVLQSVSAA